MKKLVALLAVLSYVPFAHAAEGDWTHSGEFRLQYQNDATPGFNEDAADNDQTIHQRTKLGTTVRAGEKMTFNLGIVHNADWGSNADQVPDSVDVDTTALPAASTANLLTVSEANMVWQASDVMTWKFGRVSHTIADGSVVDANTFENVGKAFDGAGLVYELEPVRLTAFGVTGAKSPVDTDTFGRFFGVSADFKTLPAVLKMANVHYIIVKRDDGSYVDLNGDGTIDATDNAGKEDSTRIGFTVSGDTAGVDYKATYAMHSGENEVGGAKTDIKSSMWDATVGYSMPEMMNFHVWLGMHQDSGDSDITAGDAETYKPFHYEQHENAGRMDVVGWGNLTYTRVGFTLAPQDDLTVGAEYLMFSKTEGKDAVYADNLAADNAATGNSAVTRIKAFNAGVDEDDIGNEMDVWVTKKYTNNFSITGRYGQFAPGDALGDDTYTQMYLEGKLAF
jgi:hypothetical protein